MRVKMRLQSIAKILLELYTNSLDAVGYWCSFRCNGSNSVTGFDVGASVLVCKQEMKFDGIT